MDHTVQLFHDQHARALTCVTEISSLLAQTPAEVKASGAAIRFSLAHLIGILKPHLTSEDRLLYPTLMAHQDPNVAQVAERFWKEMGGLSETVMTFMTRWRTTGEIERDPLGFMTAASELFAALGKRIEAEEKELYPMFVAHT